MNRAARTNPLHPLRAYWHKLAAREQNLILLAAALLALTLLWTLALAPALRSLRTAPERHAQAEQQLRRMLLLQAEAEQLRNITRPPPPGDVRALLQSALAQELGNTAQLQWTGEGSARITLTGAAAPVLARWLAQVRSHTHAAPIQLRLQRSSSAEASGPLRWDGELTLNLGNL